MELLIGDMAPAIRVAAHVRGHIPRNFEPGVTYVVEFWATWCGPCRRNIPHLTQLQQEFSDVGFIGIAVKEADPETVVRFVEEAGSSIGYAIAVDLPAEDESHGSGGWMFRNWCRAAYRLGIPASFIVDGGGRIAWIGHPQHIQTPLALMAEGNWDLRDKADAYRRQLDEQRVREICRLHDATADWQRSGEATSALAVFDEIFDLHPELELRHGSDKLEILLARDVCEGVGYAKRLSQTIAPHNEDVLFAVGRLLLDANASRVKSGTAVDGDVSALCLAVLLRAETVMKDPEAARDRMRVDSALARAFLIARDKPNAIARASSAGAWAKQANARPEVIADMQRLLEMCEVAFIDPQGFGSSCDGDACRLGT